MSDGDSPPFRRGHHDTAPPSHDPGPPATRLRRPDDRGLRPRRRAIGEVLSCIPDGLTEEQIREYLLYLSTVKKVARATHTIALCGIKFFYQQTLRRDWTVLEVARPKGEKKLPVVLSRDEVWRILDQVRIAVYRVCLTTINACGLRLMEGARLQVPDIDGERRLLHIHGKGGKDRYVPLSGDALTLLRELLAHDSQPALALPHRNAEPRGAAP